MAALEPSARAGLSGLQDHVNLAANLHLALEPDDDGVWTVRTAGSVPEAPAPGTVRLPFR